MLPRWLLKQHRKILAPTGTPLPSAFVASRSDGSEHVVSQGQNPELVTFKVCDGCNTGWMKHCENKVSSFLKPMMQGDRRDLTPQQQFWLSMWLLKTAMAMDSSENAEKKGFFTKEERHTLRENYGASISRLPPMPNTMHAWLGAYSGKSTLAVEGHTFYWLHDGPRKVQIAAYVFTLLFGQVVGQVLVAHVPFEETGVSTVKSPRINLAQRLLYQVFKPRESTISWPPPEMVDDKRVTLEDVILRWGGSGALSVPH